MLVFIVGTQTRIKLDYSGVNATRVTLATDSLVPSHADCQFHENLVVDHFESRRLRWNFAKSNARRVVHRIATKSVALHQMRRSCLCGILTHAHCTPTTRAHHVDRVHVLHQLNIAADVLVWPHIRLLFCHRHHLVVDVGMRMNTHAMCIPSSLASGQGHSLHSPLAFRMASCRCLLIVLQSRERVTLRPAFHDGAHLPKVHAQ